MSTEPTEAQVVAGVIAGTITQSGFDTTRQISYRAPIRIVSRVDAMAAQANVTRTQMLTMLLDAGIEAVQAHLPRKVRAELDRNAVTYDEPEAA